MSSCSGLVKINPFSENLSTINIQIQVVNVPQQSVMTKGKPLSRRWRCTAAQRRLLFQTTFRCPLTLSFTTMSETPSTSFVLPYPCPGGSLTLVPIDSKAAFGIADVRMALIERAQSTLRHVVGARQLQSLVTEREEIAREIEEIVEQ